MGFYELAAIHLSQQPPHFAEAALAIDALHAVLERLGDQFGENGPVLQQALQQVQATLDRSVVERAVGDADRGVGPR